MSKLYRTIVAFLGITLAIEQSEAGNGTFKNGLFNFCVSVRFNATPEELVRIRTTFQNASQILADATDGQHRFGTVTLLNNSGGSEVAEYWISNSVGCAYATLDQYGVRGQHAVLFFASNFQGKSGSDGDAYTIAHEHSHHAYGLADEYSGPFRPGCVTVPMRPDCAAECAPPPSSGDTGALTFCLMDNYFCRGGRVGHGANVNAPYTLNEFCVAGNHDMANALQEGGGNSYQQAKNGESCWETIANHPKRAALYFGGLPANTPPPAHTVTFRDGFSGLRVILAIDRSSSMLEANRLQFAKLAGDEFVKFLANGDSVGVVSFSGDVTTDFPLTTVTGNSTRTAAQSAINGLSAVVSTGTDIGDALLSARSQLAARTPRSCNEIIVLLTDGDHNIGTAPSAALPALQADGITVFTAGVGTRISGNGQTTLQGIASQTGGRYLRVGNSFDLIGLFFRLLFQTEEHVLVARVPLALTTGQILHSTVLIEPGVTTATFTAAIADTSDGFVMSVQTPTGQIVAEDSIDPNVEFITGPNSRAFRVHSPQSGLWRIIAQAGAIQTGIVELQTFAKHDGVQLNLGIAKEIVDYPNEAEIHATPTFDGMNVTHASVGGIIKRPDGSVVSAVLFDDGAPEHADVVADDGVYSMRFSNYTIEGTYEIELVVDATNGMTYAGEALFGYIGEPPITQPVPTFTRTGLASLFVRKGPTLLHEYELNGSFADRFAGPAIVADGGNLKSNGFAFGFGQGAQLSGALLRPDHYSIEMYFSIYNTSEERKVMDFKDLTSGTGLYNHDTALAFYTNVITSPVIGSPGTLVPGQMTHLVVTRDAATDQVVGFVDGVQQIAFNDRNGDGVFSGRDLIMHFFQSDIFFNTDSFGFLDFVRIYDKPLSSGEVSNLYSTVVAPVLTIRRILSCFATSNLLVNPGAETGDFTGWTIAGVSQPFVARPTNTFDQFPTHSGNFYFLGGTGSYGGFIQRVPLVGRDGVTTESIDSGRLVVNVSFWELGRDQGATIDDARVTVSCRDKASNVISILRFARVDSHLGGWSNYQGSATIATGTRFLDYTMEFFRGNAGMAINVCLDDNSLTVSGANATDGVLGLDNAQGVEIAWRSEADRKYQVQWSTTLTSNSWNNLGPPILGNGTVCAICDRTAGRERTFYRVVNSR